MQPRSGEPCTGLDKRCSDNASQRSHTIVLQNDKKRILSAAGAIEIFNDVKLSVHSKHPHAVRKQAMGFDHLVVRVDRLFVCLVPLARGLIAVCRVEVRQVTPQSAAQKLR